MAGHARGGRARGLGSARFSPGPRGGGPLPVPAAPSRPRAAGRAELPRAAAAAPPPQALEEQYSPSRWSPRLGRDAVIQAHLAATAAGTQKARASAQTSLHVPYGDGDGEKLDIYFPTDPSGIKMSQDSQPPRWCHRVWWWWQWDTTQPPKATWTPWCCKCGAASPSWWSNTLGSGAVLVSGVYDLEPILHTYVNNALNMSWEVAQRNSPMLCITPEAPAATACEVLVAVAQHDSPEFRRQSQEYSQALRAAGWSVSLLDLAGVDHFDIIEKLSEKSYVLTQVILNMISRA
ncbi:kynurenine formamidase isoform X2 [Phalacrocorax carbo]|uniref:kynurenine formamidase isoform X2 n=1 Tax=Phalacrocorax carbo TaxID=9209 RepID=UPI0031194061